MREASLALEEISLTPISFVAIAAECCQRSPGSKTNITDTRYMLPDLSDLCAEVPFADVALAWSQEGLEVYVKVHKPIQQVYYPGIERGDSVELFFDTRDVKTSGWNTRFCHHFFFLPEPIDELSKGEKTHFRTEDTHELCNSHDLQLNASSTRNSYSLSIFIPAHCLHGYDPAQFNRLGFTYRINRYGGDPQHFSVVSSDYAPEQQPSLWSSLTLVK